MASEVPVERFRDKVSRELKSGVLSLVLLAILQREGPAYGYGVLRILRERTGDALHVTEGTVYPMLKNLEDRELLDSFWQEGEGGPPRKYYQVTDAGHAALAAGLDAWRTLTTEVESLLTQPPREAEP